MSLQRIEEWYNHWNGEVYVSFSGGKDSTVLLDLVRKVYPHINGVFINTGLEYPEILKFVKTKENIIWLKPKMIFKDVIQKYGYPVISKQQSLYIYQYKTAKSEKTKIKRWYGSEYGNFKISEKWKYLINAPFNISDKCCDILKKNPIKKYEKETGFHPIIGMLVVESIGRKREYLEHGCNAFSKKRPTSNPLSFWTDQDILEYIHKFNITYANVYGDIVKGENGLLHTTGEKRTGCMFCMFGVHLEKEPNRFQRMKESHPTQYEFCIHKLGLGEILDYINVKY